MSERNEDEWTPGRIAVVYNGANGDPDDKRKVFLEDESKCIFGYIRVCTRWSCLTSKEKKAFGFQDNLPYQVIHSLKFSLI